MKKLILALFALISLQLNATHIVGGQMNYEYLGNDQYRINLTVYRDCSSGVTGQYDNPAPIGIFTTTGNVLIQSLSFTFTGATQLLPVFNVPCGTAPTNVCVETSTYTSIVTLPPVAGGYTISYQRCCRNNSIINIVNPSAVGATYSATIPDLLVANNSNPVITNPPPVYACANLPISQSFAATDADGDSLVYSLCVPYDGASATAPTPQPSQFTTVNDVIWQTGYSASNVLGTGSSLSINSQTGLLTGLPTSLGQFVFSICVAEYRNGVYIGTTKRDMQLNIVDCQITVISAFTTPAYTCGNTVNFQNGSSGASSYSWNFGDPSTTTDVSTQTGPSYTYPGPGTYTVTLIAIDPNGSSCNDTLTLPVTVQPQNVAANFSNPPVNCGTTVTFQNTSANANSYQWNFGDPSTTTDVSTQTNPSYTYPGAGTYTVSLIASSGISCADTITFDITVNPTIVTAGFTATVDACSGVATFQNSSTGTPSGYVWNFGVSGISTDTSSAINPTYQYTAPGTYTVTLIAINPSSAACNDTFTFSLTVPQPFIIDAGPDAASCSGAGVVIGPQNPPAGTTFLWAPNTGLSSVTAQNPQATPTQTTTYTLTATNAQGCSDTSSVTVFIGVFPVVEIDTALVGNCDGWQLTLTVQGVDTSVYTVTWKFSDNTSLLGPIATKNINLGDTVSVIVYVVDPLSNCNDTLQVSNFLPLVSQLLIQPVPNVFTPNGDSYNECFKPAVYPGFENCYTMSIYNRWGRVVFETDATHNCWNGKVKSDGSEAAEGAYYYIMDFEGKKYNGTVMLLKGK